MNINCVYYRATWKLILQRPVIIYRLLFRFQFSRNTSFQSIPYNKWFFTISIFPRISPWISQLWISLYNRLPSPPALLFLHWARRGRRGSVEWIYPDRQPLTRWIMAAVTRRAILDKARPTSVTRLLNTAHKARLSIFLPLPWALGGRYSRYSDCSKKKKKGKRKKKKRKSSRPSLNTV